ncbi:UNVERIFIED_CONTAM: hypothetical protein FKN15_001005 [Acipenser sinensis]
MSPQNISIVFGPTLMRPEKDFANIAINMVYQNQVVEDILRLLHLKYCPACIKCPFKPMLIKHFESHCLASYELHCHLFLCSDWLLAFQSHTGTSSGSDFSSCHALRS